jgi:hypothetical protein
MLAKEPQPKAPETNPGSSGIGGGTASVSALPSTGAGSELESGATLETTLAAGAAARIAARAVRQQPADEVAGES